MTGAGVGFEVASLLNFSIAGEITEDADLREFRTDRSVYNIPEVKFTARVENLGNVLVRPTGIIEISDMFGKKRAVVRVNDAQAGVFPKDIRTFTADWKAEGFAIGRYQAIVSLVYGDEGRQTISSSASFWVLPAKPILYTLGAILGLIALMVVLVKVYVKRKLRQVYGGAKGDLGAKLRVPAGSFNPSFFRLVVLSSSMLVAVIILMVVLFMFFS